MAQRPQPLPYGLSDDTVINREEMTLVDKTGFIPALEEAGKFLFMLRPRRFGKSLWISMLNCYYDINYADRFEVWFGDTAIGRQPTKERNHFLVLSVL